MKKQLIGLGVVTGCMVLGLASNAFALLVTVDDNIANNTYLANGSTLSGQFDINPALPDNDQYVMPYDINNATTNFNFSDDGDSSFHSYTGSYYQDYSAYNSTYTYVDGRRVYTTEKTYLRNTYDYVFDEYEGVQVTMGLQTSIDGTTYFNITDYLVTTTSTEDITTRTYTYWSWGGSRSRTVDDYVTIRYTTTNRTMDYGYTGAFSISNTLDTSAVSDLSIDGIVGYDIFARGDMFLDSATLTVDINENPAPVPEPATMLLFGTGLVGLVGSRIRKKKQQ